MEPTAELVVDAAARHTVEGQLDHFEDGRVFGSKVLSKQKLKRHRLWELGL